MEIAAGSAAVALLVKSSALTATCTGLLDALVESLRTPPPGSPEGGGGDDEEEPDPAAVAAARPLRPCRMLRALRIGAGCLVVCPVAFATVASSLGVPWQTALSSCLISEACLAPVSVWVLRNAEEDPEGKLYRFAPLAVIVSTWGTFAVTYTISVVIMKHRIALFPIISATGELAPESIAWTVGSLITGGSLMLMTRGWELGYKGQSHELVNRVEDMSGFGYLSGIGFIFVGVFRSGPIWTNFIHFPAAVIGWASFWILMAYHTHLSSLSQPAPGAPRDTSKGKIDAISVRDRRYIFLIWSGISGMCFASMHEFVVVRAISEYSTAISWSLCVSTFHDEFRKGMIGQPPEQWGEGPGDSDAFGGVFDSPKPSPALAPPQPDAPAAPDGEAGAGA